jgi:hypothetical protein
MLPYGGRSAAHRNWEKSMADQDDGDKVGYARPPRATQFRRGNSGNPRGRPKGARNLLSDLRAELSAETRVTEAGRQITVTKQAAIVKSLARLIHEASTN